MRALCHVTQDELGEGQQANEKQRSMRELEEAAKVRVRDSLCGVACYGVLCMCVGVLCALWR